MAGALNRWLDKTVEPKAKELLGSPVIKLENIIPMCVGTVITAPTSL
jgi:hypothetical protein